jgi:N-glycosylase/DNA lyase
MKTLIKHINTLRQSKVKQTIDSRIKEFEKQKNIFNELCFCLLTANFNAERSIKIQSEINNGFITFPEKKLAKKLKELGHRFPNARAKYIVEARKHKNLELNREWLIKNIKGLGYKEVSHFLRNIGHTDVAIIDFHIIDILVKYNLIEKPKTLTKMKYLEIEKLLNQIAKKSNLNLAELDLYLWFSETGKVLK